MRGEACSIGSYGGSERQGGGWSPKHEYRRIGDVKMDKEVEEAIDEVDADEE
jgi:hypothetical protein